MDKFLRRLPLSAKLLLIGLIPFIFLIFLTMEIYNEKTRRIAAFDNYKIYMASSANINGLIDALQQERKYSFDFAMTKSMKKELLLQMPKTDALLQKLIKSNDPSLSGFPQYTKLKDLPEIRKAISNAKAKPSDVMHFYSNSIFRLNTLNTIPISNNADLRPIYKDLMAQKALSEMNTYLGIIRSNIYNVLYTKAYMVETLMGTYPTYDVYKSYDVELRAKAKPEVIQQYNAICKTTAFKPTSDYMDALFKRFSFDESLTAAEWWKISDEGSDELRKLQNGIWEKLNKKLNELHKSEENARTRTLLFLIFALICILGIIIYIISLIRRPLEELRQTAERISHGETANEIKITSHDSIGSLANSIYKINKSNKLLADAAMAIGRGDFTMKLQPRSENDILGNAIIQMQNELRQYNAEMKQLVAERTEELERSNDDLRQFAHVASHDLKEPLRKITMFSRILNDEQKEVLSEKGKLYLQKIGNASERMSAMIEGILSYSTVSVNEPQFEKVDLNKIMEGVENDLELAIIQKEAQLRYKSLPTVTGLPLLLQQLFYNLVNNALKFSKADLPPKITITAEKQQYLGEKKGNVKAKSGNYHKITITDNGIGFNPEYAERMFAVFFRLNAKDEYEGSGIGLALCKKIVHRHGGEIYAEGEEGVGARFIILLPV